VISNSNDLLAKRAFIDGILFVSPFASKGNSAAKLIWGNEHKSKIKVNREETKLIIGILYIITKKNINNHKNK
jgi:hypothetical protein